MPMTAQPKEEIPVTLARHDQHIKSLQHQVDDLKDVTGEIRAMNETLVVLASELKHTNAHLERHERKLGEIDGQPKARLNQIVTAIIAALAGGLVSAIIAMVMK